MGRFVPRVLVVVLIALVVPVSRADGRIASQNAQSCVGANVGDNNVLYAGLFHDSFASFYRSPGGPVTAKQGTVTLRFRTCANDVSAASVRVWDDRANTETLVPMTFGGNGSATNLGTVAYWKATLPISTTPTILYYTFQATDGSATGYYRDDDPRFYGGGYGLAESAQSVAYDNSYQLTVYDPNYAVPSWMQRGIVYQIFPDRFRDGSATNDPPTGRFSYGASAIVRSGHSDWNSTICDPRNMQVAAFNCDGHYSDNFYGGDLQGITEKVNAGYFDSLGVTVLYLNPIFRSPSNHKYDTADYLTIDPDFGTLADFEALVAAANAHGMKIILDGVFNHTSSDSTYFDRYSRYDAAGDLVSANGAGSNDGSGACEAASSPYRAWYYFPATDKPGADSGTGPVQCAGNATYEAWYGYSSLPKLQANSPQVRALIWSNGLHSVGPYWTKHGANGWRFDVGGDVDPGLTNDPKNDYWEGFRAAVRNRAVTGKSDVLMLGEEWGDASAWLLGNEWDSVMNYRFRSTVLSWLFTGCTGNGCTAGAFADNDSNAGSSSGPISALSPSQFNARLRAIQEDYPPPAFKAMMNLAGSHDTNRLRFLLKKINNDNDAAAVQRMKEWWLFAFTYAGAPTLYYGDEVGLSHDGVFATDKFEDDPYNRAPFPWDDTPGSYSADTTNLLPFARSMASIRLSYGALQDGDVQHGLIVDDANKLYGFARTNGKQTALIALNRDGTAHTATFRGLRAAPYNLPDGAQLVDAISGKAYTVAGGAVSVDVNPTWGAVLLERTNIDTPAAAKSIEAQRNGATVALHWPQVATDRTGGHELVTRYEVYRSTSATFKPSSSSLVATVGPQNFGSPGAQIVYNDSAAPAGRAFYIIRAINSAGSYSDSTGVAAR